MTKEEIDSKHEAIWLTIRQNYEAGIISHEDEHTQWNQENDRYTAELIANGYLAPPPGTCHFTMPASPPDTPEGIKQRVTYIETFLGALYP